MYDLINVLPRSNFAVFNCRYFVLLIAQSRNLDKLVKLTSFFLFLPLIGTQGYIFYRLTTMLMSKNVNTAYITP